MEQWKDIPNYIGLYQASNHGRIKSILFGKERILKDCKNKCGYKTVVLCKEKKCKTKYVHRLVYNSFNESTNLHIDHINEIKTDNNISNLQALSNRENCVKSIIFKGNKKSKYIGVHLEKKSNRWKSMIRINNKHEFLGLFDNEILASQAYQNKLMELKNK